MKIKSKFGWFEQLRPLLAQSRGITRLQGSPHADYVLCAPVPTQAELDNNYCWCNPSAVVFFEKMQSMTNISPDQFLVIPVTFDGKKPVKANTALPQAIFEQAAPHFKKFICIGSDAFKTFFGYGKKPSMSMLAGSIIYVKGTNHRPLFTFPDLDGLAPNWGACASKRDKYIEQMRVEDTNRRFENLLVKFNQIFLPL